MINSNIRQINTNYGFGREFDLQDFRQKKGKLFNKDDIDILNDREMFNKTSTITEELDMSNNDLIDNFGIPTLSRNILKNKKSLITMPYIQENNDKDNFTAKDCELNNMFALVDTTQQYNGKNMDSLTSRGFNCSETNDDYSKCKIERDILSFEYEVNTSKQNKFMFYINSPFALAYLWKAIIILTKNPTTQKLLTALKVERKDVISSDLKKYGNIFEDLGSLKLYIPLLNNHVDSNVIISLADLYKINVNIIDNVNNSNNVEIYLDYNFSLEIPNVYNPREKYDYFLNYRKNKTKFIEMFNVTTSLLINEKTGFVNLEIPMASDLILGFLYSTNMKLLDEIDYDFITMKKQPNTFVKSLVIPKINRTKQSIYSENFKEMLTGVHFGEIVYGKLFDVLIKTNISLEIEIANENVKTHKINNKLDKININHPCYFYIKHNNIENKIFMNGFINY